MAGVYSTVLLIDVDHADLLVDKEQVAAVTGDPARPKAPVWHGGEILVAGHASLALEYVQLGQYAELEISKLVYGAGEHNADSDSYAARYQGSTDYTGHLVGGSLSLAKTSLDLATLATLKGKLTAGNSLRLSGVTLREVPEAGLLSGVMVSAVNGEPHDRILLVAPSRRLCDDRAVLAGTKHTTPPNFGSRTTGSFSVTSGPCTVAQGGRCVGRPAGYLPDDHCEIVVGGGGGKLGACPVFDISDMGDRLQLPADAPGVLPKPTLLPLAQQMRK